MDPALTKEVERVAREREVKADDVRRSPLFFFQTAASLVTLALTPLVPHAESLFGELTVTKALLSMTPGLTMWILNFVVFHRAGRDHWFYRNTQVLELWFLDVYTMSLIFWTGSAASVIWCAAPMSVLYRAELRPSKFGENLVMTSTAYLALVIAFAAQGKTSDAALSFALGGCLTLLHLLMGGRAIASIRLEAARNLSRLKLDELRLVGWRKQLESHLRLGVGRQLDELIDELRKPGTTASHLLEPAQKAKAELDRIVWETGFSESGYRFGEFCELVKSKCAPLLPHGEYVQEVEGDVGRRMSAELVRAILRLTQELTRNAVVHGQAAVVEVRFALAESLRVSIQDDGEGLSEDAWAQSTGGIHNARERVRSLGGAIRFHTEGPSAVIEIDVGV